MPEAYCNCCRKTTPHKVVMRRCQTEPTTGWQGFQQFMAALMHGEHYYKMENRVSAAFVINNPIYQRLISLEPE